MANQIIQRVFKTGIVLAVNGNYRNDLQSGLKLQGINLLAGSSQGQVALNTITSSKTKCDLVIAELRLSDANAIQVFASLRKVRKLSKCHFFLLVEPEDQGHIKSALAYGLSGFAIKPVNKDMLVAKVFNLVSTLAHLKGDHQALRTYTGAQFYELEEDYESALVEYEVLRNKDPQNPVLVYDIGRMYMLTDKASEGQALLQHALTLNPQLKKNVENFLKQYQGLKKSVQMGLDYPESLKLFGVPPSQLGENYFGMGMIRSGVVAVGNSHDGSTIQHALAGLGIRQVDVVNSGKGLLQSLVTNKPNILFLDIVLNDANGLQLIKIIREENKFKNILIILILEEKYILNIESAYEFGLDGIMLKQTYSGNVIREAIHKMMVCRSFCSQSGEVTWNAKLAFSFFDLQNYAKTKQWASLGLETKSEDPACTLLFAMSMHWTEGLKSAEDEYETAAKSSDEMAKCALRMRNTIEEKVKIELARAELESRAAEDEEEDIPELDGPELGSSEEDDDEEDIGMEDINLSEDDEIESDSHELSDIELSEEDETEIEDVEEEPKPIHPDEDQEIDGLELEVKAPPPEEDESIALEQGFSLDDNKDEPININLEQGDIVLDDNYQNENSGIDLSKLAQSQPKKQASEDEEVNLDGLNLPIESQPLSNVQPVQDGPTAMQIPNLGGSKGGSNAADIVDAFGAKRYEASEVYDLNMGIKSQVVHDLNADKPPIPFLDYLASVGGVFSKARKDDQNNFGKDLPRKARKLLDKADKDPENNQYLIEAGKLLTESGHLDTLLDKLNSNFQLVDDDQDLNNSYSISLEEQNFLSEAALSLQPSLLKLNEEYNLAEQEFDKVLDDAVELFSEGNLKQDYQPLVEALEKAHHSFESYKKVYWKLKNLKKQSRCKHFFHRKSKYFIVEDQTRDDFGSFLAEMENSPECREVFLNAHYTDVKNTLYLEKLAYLDLKSENYKYVIRWSKKIVSLDKTSEYAYNLLGVANKKLNKLKKAVSFYVKGIRFNPKSVKLHYNLAILYAQMGRKSDSKQALDMVNYLKKVQENEDDDAAA